MEKIYIAGAHSRAQTLKVYLNYLYPNIIIEAFLVTDIAENELVIDGIPVILIEKGLQTEYPVYIGTRGANHKKMIEALQLVGIKTIIPVTVDLDSKLRNEYVHKFYQQNDRNLQLIDECKQNVIRSLTEYGKTATIYVATSIYDKPLQNKYEFTADERVIQVGASLTTERIYKSVLVDCEGDNISAKNRQYCELTGLYWLWKHAKEDFIGLVHYRRHFMLPENWKEKMEDNHIDVILPVPLYVAPSIDGNYRSRHISTDWEYLIRYFKKNFMEEYNFFEMFLNGNLYSPCNMFVMRRNVLHDLCNWLFPILDEVVQHGGKKEDIYLNRYPGFISERLISYFFERHRDKYKIAYANKNFLM